ncbi:TetR/AcrR family transcriptional regulator [Marinobacterium jannaschii]|uniref:TetR/AcrR family transcriptional regulator n=1 Tax=Marinobacterium jannaschii TaxID=64970 RepID=UPI000481165F|nr:TetR/AcrR family transcriptional regulator [Marinobacterium jannaschii]
MSKGRRTEHNREKILTTGMELFTRQGYHATGLKEILDACEIPKGSFYNFFDSKEAFAIEIIEHYQAIELARWNETLELYPGNRLDGIHSLIQEAICCHQDEPDKIGCLLANLSGEIVQASPALHQCIRESITRILDAIEGDIRLCQQEGSIRSDFSARQLAEMIWDHWQGAILRMKVEQRIDPLIAHCDNFMRILRASELTQQA